MNESNLTKMKDDLQRLIDKGEQLYFGLADELGILGDDIKRSWVRQNFLHSS